MNESSRDQDQARGQSLSRQNAIKRLLGVGVAGWLGAIIYPVTKYLIPPPAGEANVTSLKVGMIDEPWEKPYRIIQFGRKPVILVKDTQDQIRALAATCTHLACIVQYQEQDNIIWCACHNAKFDLSGKVISGPPPGPLQGYDVNITDTGEIWVSQKQV